MSRSRLSVPITLFRRNHQLQYARLMRRAPTASEAHLWQHARLGQLGYRVKRQVVIGSYICDFVVPSVRLIVEVDGSAHYGQEHNDARRQRELEFLGYTVLRVTAQQVLRDIHAVLRRIRAEVARLTA